MRGLARSLGSLIETLKPGGMLPPEMQGILSSLTTHSDEVYLADESWHYYQGDIYTWLQDQRHLLATRRKTNLYRNVRPFFNPVPEIVDVAADKVFAPKVRGINLDKSLDTRLNALWTRSRFEKLLYRYVREGAAVGTVYLQVLDGKQATVVTHRPDEMTVWRNPQTNAIMLARVSYMVVDPLGMEKDETAPGVPTYQLDSYAYDFVMTPEWYATFRDQKLWAYSSNPYLADGATPQAIWPNVLGMVPVVEVHHQEDGESHGTASWHAYKDTIDRTNEIASFMAETIKMHIDPLVIVKGVARSDVEKSIIDGKTQVWYLPFPQNPTDPQPSVELMEWSGRASQAQEFIAWVAEKMADVCPELQLARIQQQANPSGLSVALQSSRFVGHIERLRANYVHGLVEADRLALYAEDVHNGVVTASPDILADEDKYSHSVQCGRVLPADETTDFANGLSLLNANLIPRVEMLTRFGGYSLPDAEKLLKEADAEAEKRAEQARQRMLDAGDNRGMADDLNETLPNGSDKNDPRQTAGAFRALRSDNGKES